MKAISGAFLAALAGIAAIALTTTEAEASSLGARFPDLRQDIQDRVDAIPAEGATSLEAKERKKLLAALVHLDTDSPTLDTDVILARKALALLPKVNQVIYYSPEAALVLVYIRDEIQELMDNPPYYPIFDPLGSKVFHMTQVAQYWLGSGTLDGDPVKACKFYAKALKTVRKRDKAAAKEIVPAKSTRLKFLYQSEGDIDAGTLYKSGKSGVVLTGSYDQSDDVLTLGIAVVEDGVQHQMTLLLTDPGVGEMFPTGGTITVPGSTCEPGGGSGTITISAWDPVTGLVSGSGYFGYLDPADSPEEDDVWCGGGAMVFTVRNVTVVP